MGKFKVVAWIRIDTETPLLHENKADAIEELQNLQAMSDGETIYTVEEV